ncbi:MAG: glycosyltransferase [Candidatus Omnitrophica bacterium]|nr:glycosyltransferase [Candidatus Omnitrophota bacterium]
MRILIGHNQYQNYGGEDAVAMAEQRLLEEHGHTVYKYTRSNTELKNFPFKEKSRFMWYLAWSDKSYQELRKIIREFKPDIAHFHNIYFMMTPAVYYACQDEGVPVVQSLHNFRPLCANGLLFRNNHVCEKCLKGSLLNGIWHRCYQKSWIISALLVRMLSAHRKMNTWKDKVDAFITATEFTKSKYLQAGFAPDKIFIKPNFLYASPPELKADQGYALYVGRLSEEKGVEVLVNAWKEIKDYPLKIVGDGPLKAYLSGLLHNNQIQNVELLGHVDDNKRNQLLQGAKFVIVPSICYETFSLIVAESMAYGVPVIGSRLGSLQEIIEDQKDGMLFEAGNSQDLANKVKQCISSPEYENMRRQALAKYQKQFSTLANYEILMNIYNNVLSKNYPRS